MVTRRWELWSILYEYSHPKHKYGDFKMLIGVCARVRARATYYMCVCGCVCGGCDVCMCVMEPEAGQSKKP